MPKKPKSSTLRGKVIAHNISPKGHIEGVLLRTSTDTVQVNLPKHRESELSARMKIGDQVELVVEPADSEGEHPVYMVTDSAARTEGIVKQLNYTRHGEVNGYRLQDGTFVHVKPDGARRAKVQVGDRIAADGVRIVGDHAVVLETDRVSKLPAVAKK